MEVCSEEIDNVASSNYFCKCHVIFAISLKSQTAKIMQVDMNLNCH